MTSARGTLFDEVADRLPLFEDLPPAAIERLVAGGFGRGLLTASLRARLRKAGFIDMGRLATASPGELAKVRKIGPVRVEGIRAHLVEELARILPDARSGHGAAATAERRLDHLRTMPSDRLPVDEDVLAKMACATCTDIAGMSRLHLVRALHIPLTDLDRIVTTLARFILTEKPRIQLVPDCREDDPAAEAARLREERARLQQVRDREWEEAAPRAVARIRRDPRRRSRENA